MKRKTSIAELQAASDYLVEAMESFRKLSEKSEGYGYQMKGVTEILKYKEAQADLLHGEMQLEIFNLKNGDASDLATEEPDKLLVDNFVNKVMLALGDASLFEKITLQTLV